MCSKASQPRRHSQAPRLITRCSAFKLQRIKAKMAKFVSALLCESICHDSGLFGEVTGSDVTERKGSNEITCPTCNSEAFVWASASLCIRDCSRRLMCASVFSRHRSLLIHRRSKSGGSPAAWQIGTPDLCLCRPLICPPTPRHNPSPANLSWQVEVALGCPWPRLHGGPVWDWIRLDQTGLTLCERVSGSRKELRVSERLFWDFYFSDSGCNESHRTLFDVQAFSSS